MNRNTWIITIVAVIVIIGLIWIFNPGAGDQRFGQATMVCLSSVEQDGHTYCTDHVWGNEIRPSTQGENG